MSQVIVTNDNLGPLRQKALEQEHRIQTEVDFKKWHRSDVVGFDPVKNAVGVAVLPVVAFWGILMACISVAFAIAANLMRLAGKVFGPGKGLR